MDGFLAGGGPRIRSSLVFIGEHATAKDLATAEMRSGSIRDRGPSRRMFHSILESWALNRAHFRRLTNSIWQIGTAKAGGGVCLPGTLGFLFLPARWSRRLESIYGRRGLLQHQCVIPLDAATSVLGEIIERVSRQGNASFLAVLKQLAGGRGLMSFPIKGYTLAIDFPASREVFPLLDEIDRLVVSAGGQVILQKMHGNHVKPSRPAIRA